METLVRNQNIKRYGINKEERFAGVKLKGFENEQREDTTFMNAKIKEVTKEMLGIIDDNSYNVTERLTYSILSKMIKRKLSTLDDKIEINVADLYQTYTDMWIEGDDNLSQMTSDGRRMFMWQFALAIFQRKSGLSLHYSQLDKPEREHLKEHFIATDEDYYQHEVTTCPFLNRDKNGYYSFVHKSFMEFFLAQYFFYELKNNFRIDNAFDFNQETKFFLKSIILLNKSCLHGLDLSNLSLSDIDLEGVNLTRTNLSGCILLRAKLKMAKLCDADLSKAILCEADLSCANLSGANLNKVNMDNANLFMANLDNTNLHETKLCKADLTLAKLNYTDLSNADLSGAILCKTVLNNTKLKKAKLYNTDLSLAKLSDIDLSGFDLEGVDFRMADLSNSNLKGANLKNANFSKANLNGTIFD